MSRWQALREELDAWREAGRTIRLWWRDDDAQQPTPELQRLNRLSLDYRIPLHLAVIPNGAEVTLGELLDRNPRLWVLQHGFSHQNHAPAGQRKCELGDHRPLSAVSGELAAGHSKLERLFGQRFLPVLVPPWNRLAPEVAAALPGLGFKRLSVLGPRPQLAALREANVGESEGHDTEPYEVNVHIDLINWRQGGRFAGEDIVLQQLLAHLRAKRLRQVDSREPTGLMTHHLAHDEACWRFCEQLFAFLAAYPSVTWVDGPELLAG